MILRSIYDDVLNFLIIVFANAFRKYSLRSDFKIIHRLLFAIFIELLLWLKINYEKLWENIFNIYIINNFVK